MAIHLSAKICCSECDNSAENDDGTVIFNIKQEDGSWKKFLDNGILFIGLQLRGIEFEILCPKCSRIPNVTIENAKKELKTKA